MKLKFISVSLFGLLASCLIATAQSAAPAGANPQPAVALAATPAPAEIAATTAPATVAQDAAATGTNTNTNSTVATGAATDTGTNAATATGGPRDPNAVMPLIQMKDALLTDAIENLARQAGLNYILDPKIPYLSTGPDRVPQPTVSLRWENLTAEQALSAVLDNFNLTIVDNPKTHISRITVKDPTAPDPLVTKTIQLKYADPTNMLANVQSILMDRRSKVVADVRTSQLVLTATEKEVTAVDELITRLDTQTKQVLIEARLIETSTSPNSVKGINWSGTLQAQNVTFGNNQYIPPPSTSVNPLVPLSPIPRLLVDTAKGFNPTTAFLNADGVSAVLSYLNSATDAEVLSTPRAVTLDNQEAVLSVTTAQPIFLTTAGTQGSPGGSQVNYTNVGTILRVTPRISANNTINLRVVPEVSDLAGEITKTVAGLVNQADSFDVRRIDTRVLIPSGNTLVMGGLQGNNSTKGMTKVPLLGDIPAVGWLFRSENKTQTKRNLLVFITPTIVQNEDFQPTQTDFLKTRFNDKSTIPITPWDRSEPQNWSKLFGKQSSESAAPVYPEVSAK